MKKKSGGRRKWFLMLRIYCYVICFIVKFCCNFESVVSKRVIFSYFFFGRIIKRILNSISLRCYLTQLRFVKYHKLVWIIFDIRLKVLRREKGGKKIPKPKHDRLQDQHRLWHHCTSFVSMLTCWCWERVRLASYS